MTRWSMEYQKKCGRIYASVDLDDVVYNLKSMKDHLDDGVGMLGVVKADGYGHGSVPVAKAIDPYVKGYGVATVDEALIMRNHGINKMILVLGPVHESRFEEMIRFHVRPSVFQFSDARIFSEIAVKIGVIAPIHIALDTGMSRIGFWPGDEAVREVKKIHCLPGIEIEGIFTHFARADERDKTWADAQLKEYLDFVSRLEEEGIHIPLRHCANSAGIIDMKQSGLDLVRAGISIYGLYPSEEVDKTGVILKPALSLKTYVSCVKEIPAGTPVSYGGTFVANRRTAVATLPVGYADGYPRNLSGCGEVLIRGRRAPILGRICMDQMMVDVTDIDGAKQGDLVTLIGEDGEDRITVEELAARCGGFHYEILCGIGKRVPRIYRKDGLVVGMKDDSNDCYQEFPGGALMESE